MFYKLFSFYVLFSIYYLIIFKNYSDTPSKSPEGGLALVSLGARGE
jgi:hypothetical protein